MAKQNGIGACHPEGASPVQLLAGEGALQPIRPRRQEVRSVTGWLEVFRLANGPIVGQTVCDLYVEGDAACVRLGNGCVLVFRAGNPLGHIEFKLPADNAAAWRTEFKTVVALPLTAVHGRLTVREWEVMRAVAGGLGNKEIASQYGMSLAAVKAILQRLFRKSGVRTRCQLVRVALDGYFGEL